MGLNPLRESLGNSASRAAEAKSSFRAVAESSLATFRAARKELERRVRQGDLTVKAAREAARSAAAELARDLQHRSESFTYGPKLFRDRLAEVALKREESRKHRSIEDLQRETNLLLRQTLLEQQIQNRLVEFEGQTYVRPLAGGPPATSLGSLLRFHETARLSGDEAAMEWGRRQLEGMRSRIFSDEERSLIDQACDRPDRINSRIIQAHLERLEKASVDEMEAFVTQALDTRDVNSCIALFVSARKNPADALPSWARRTLQNLDLFPDAALTTLREWESEAYRLEAEEARAQAEYAARVAAHEAALHGLKAPSEAELLRQANISARPVAEEGEPIGLNLLRRGRTREELAAAEQGGSVVDQAGDEVTAV